MVNWVGWARGKWKKKKILLTNWDHQVALSILYGLWVPSQGLRRDKSCSKPRGTQKIAEIVGSSSNSHRPEGKAGLELLSILLKATALAQSQDWLTYPSSDVFELYHIIPLLRTEHSGHNAVFSHDRPRNALPCVWASWDWLLRCAICGNSRVCPPRGGAQAAVPFFIPPVGEALNTGFGPPVGFTMWP